MKVTGTRQVETSSVRRSSRVQETGGDSFSVDRSAPEKHAAPVAPANPLTALDALLTLQSVPQAGDGRKRATRRADEMLDLLDGIRLGLLDGRIPRGKLESLLRIVRVNRDEIPDPRLAQVLDEVELRASVELAKYGAAP